MQWEVGTLVFNRTTNESGTVTHIHQCEFGLWTVITSKTKKIASTMDSLMWSGWKAKKTNARSHKPKAK
jgi:hypothetical protein